MIIASSPLIYFELKYFFLFFARISSKMLFYNIINDDEGRDNSENFNSNSKENLTSKQCITCRFYYFISKNFNNKKYICDGCFHCIVYENENPGLIFRIVTVEKGTFRTVSNYFFVEIEKILEDFNPDKKFGWIYKKELETE